MREVVFVFKNGKRKIIKISDSQIARIIAYKKAGRNVPNFTIIS